MRLRYEFRRAAAQGGGTRSLPDVDQAAGIYSVVGESQGTEEAPGGHIDWTGTISVEEYEANPTFFAQGTNVVIFDEDDADVDYPTGRCIWGGEIDRPPAIEAGKAKLHARGDGAKPYTVFADRLWETRNEDRLVAGDSEPHEYDQDEQIEAKIIGRGLRLGWEKKTIFLRATGETHLASDANKDATSISLVANAGGLVDDEEIHIGSETKHVHPSYSSGSTTVPLTSGLDAKHKAGTHVYWRASGNPDEWASGALMWLADRDINSVQIDLHLTRHASATLEIRRAVGPDGATTLLQSIDCSAGALDRTIEIENITGNPDLIYWRLVRRVQTDESGADRSFWAVVHDIRVRGLAGNTSDYSPAQVVLDIIAAEGGEVGNVPSSTFNMMPLDGEGASDGAILDEASMLTKRYWVRRRKLDGSGFTWRFEAFGVRKTWLLTRPRSPVVPQTLEQWNGVQVNYQRPGGQIGHLTRFADPDPFPGEEIVKAIELDEAPPEDIADAFARNAADELALEEQVARLEFSHLEDQADPGVEVPGSRARSGDLIIAGPDDYSYPASKFSWTGDGVIVMDSSRLRPGETGRPALDRIIKRRSLALARGASQAKATLGGFQLDRPTTPTNVAMGIRLIEKRGGRRRYDAILTCDNVTEDINGKGTAIQRYVGIFEFQDAAGDWVTDDDGERMQMFRHSERKRSDDGSVVPAAAKVIFKNVPHPHKWKVVGKMFCVDVFDEKSHVSSATSPIKPSTFGPTAPSAVALDVDQHWARYLVTLNDPDENDADGTPSWDQSVDYIKGRLLKGGVEVIGWRKLGRRLEGRLRVHKPGSATYQLQIKSVDSYGNESAVTSGSNTRGVPPDPVSAPSAAVDKGGRKKPRLTLSGTYAGAHADDDVHQGRLHVTIDGKLYKPLIKIDDDGTWSHVFVGLDKNDAWSAKYKVTDDDGKESGYSPTASGTLTDVTPPSPAQPAVVTHIRKVVVKSYKTTGDRTEVAAYEVEIGTSSSTTDATFAASVVDSETTKAGRVEFIRSQGSTNVYARVRSVGPSDNVSAWVYSSGGGSSNAGADKNYTDDLDRSGNLDVFAAYENALSGTRVEIDTAGVVAHLQLWTSGLGEAGGLTWVSDAVFLTNPAGSAGNQHPIGIYGGLSEMTIDIDEVIQNDIGRGACGGHVPGGKAVTDDTWGWVATYGAATKLDHTPSTITLTNQSSSNVKGGSPNASAISNRGFCFTADVNSGGSFMRAFYHYVTN